MVRLPLVLLKKKKKKLENKTGTVDGMVVMVSITAIRIPRHGAIMKT
jgi:hypothetical protein